jgi:putative addiction module CopG family antidote
MPYPFPSDVQRMLDVWLSSGQYATEDDVLREALRALNEEHEDLEAVREAVAEWRAGDAGIPVADAFDEVRRSLSPRPQE